MEIQELKELFFCIVYREKIKTKCYFWALFWQNLGKNDFFKKIELRHFLASIVP